MKTVSLPHAILLLNIISWVGSRNNACGSFSDYFYPENNKNCWYNPDPKLKSPDLIKKYAGVFEKYEVITEDGYVLTIFRIPKEKPKGVILLHHPLLADSMIYLLQGNDSLAIILWKAGYDVWLNNQRGTYHSERHVNLTTSDTQYWDFSFHEVGKYDVPSEIRLIREKTGNSKIVYFGHSLGSTVGLVYASLYPEDARDAVETFIFAATPCYFQFNHNPVLRLAAENQLLIADLAAALKLEAFLPALSIIKEIYEVMLRNMPPMFLPVLIIEMTTSGITPDQADAPSWSFDVISLLRNFSTKLILHYLQLIRVKDRFQMYDYGSAVNLELYGTDWPALYPIWNISTPIYLISSTEDIVNTLEDADLLYGRLPDKAKIHGWLHISGLNHNGFLVGKDRKKIFYDQLLSFLNRI